ncbi:TIM barrel protein [Octadecabacter ascidiaceicola]|uniref:Xylose isomerase-like TIM barrel n=1 Tax=Octadecabacter ascidiaceicola TaxID=1655543 RepID=A0A238K5J9_9RHOB|nr:TIM barrel protein [Octadecabacter ascidiaceicola]SMX38178.1 Xylose isomerase-like TIM barrel [Octadecabacter ascidiaceicola]
MNFALNHMTVPNLGYAEFLDLAAKLGCIGVEVRNDITRELFDGMDPAEAGKLASDKGLRILGLSQVYPFNDWTTERETAVRELIETATAAGAETVNLIPRNDGTAMGDGERQSNLQTALTAILPMLQDANIDALVEPLGFQRSSLRSKAELVETINSIGGSGHIKMVHDTFHHTLAGGGDVFAKSTGIVHISAVTEAGLRFEDMEDEHRVLVDARDRLGNIEQINALVKSGYTGAFSYECFSPVVHAMSDPYAEINASFEFISDQLRSWTA